MNDVIIDILSITRRTAAIITKGSPVKFDTDTDYVVTSTSAGDKAIIGIATETSVAGGTVRVLMIGICGVTVKTASGLAVGDMIMQSDTAGKVVEVGASAGTNYPAIGKVLIAPGADNDRVSCLVCPASTFQA